MRRMFVLVGLVLAVFVFPYVLNIEDSEAAGLGCQATGLTNKSSAELILLASV